MPDYGTVMMPARIPPLNAVQPDGKVRPPLVVVSGEEGIGKSTELVKLTGDERIGATWGIEWGAGDAGILHEYSTRPGARYTLLGHDGTVQAVYGQILAARVAARKALADGERPHMLAIDSFSTEWDLIKSWTYRRMAAGITSQAAKYNRIVDPNADVRPGRNLWNDARDRHKQMMSLLLSWPGPVLLTCRAEWVSGTDPDSGQPTKERLWRIQAHETLVSDATVVFHLRRHEKHLLAKVRSAHYQLDPKKPVEIDDMADYSIGDLLFDKMGYTADPGTLPRVADVEALDSIPEAFDPQTAIGRGQEPQREDVDWDGELVKLRVEDGAELATWARVHATLGRLYKAAAFQNSQFGQPGDEMVERIAALGRNATRMMWRRKLLDALGDDAAYASVQDQARNAGYDIAPLVAELAAAQDGTAGSPVNGAPVGAGDAR
jgi:hypothetical protein